MVATAIKLNMNECEVAGKKKNRSHLGAYFQSGADFNQYLETNSTAWTIKLFDGIRYTRRKPLIAGEVQKIIGVCWICKENYCIYNG